MKLASSRTAEQIRQVAMKPSSIFTVIAVALAAMAVVVHTKTRQAEEENPPRGKFIDVDGVRLPYLEQGSGQPLVLIHGNGTMAEDYPISTVFYRATKTCRVIAFDRPGYGYSERSSSKIWDATAQAHLLHKALVLLGVEQPVVVGHSWGTLVALSMALDQPDYVRHLVLLSGYYYPTSQLDVVLSAPLAIPLIGHVMRHTISPLFGRLIWPLAVRKLFTPSQQPTRFKALFPVWMSMRPSQLRASVGDGVMMIPEATRLADRYHELRLPIIIMAGSGDLLALVKLHSERLHKEIAHSELVLVPRVGHMIHQVVPEEVMEVIDRACHGDTLAA